MDEAAKPKSDDQERSAENLVKDKVELTKAQRREIQERQRAEKAQRLIAEGRAPAPKPAQRDSSTGSVSSTSSTQSAASSSSTAPKKPPTKHPAPTPASVQFDDPKVRSKVEKTQLVHRTESVKQVALFSHLRQYEQENSLTAELKYRMPRHFFCLSKNELTTFSFRLTSQQFTRPSFNLVFARSPTTRTSFPAPTHDVSECF